MSTPARVHAALRPTLCEVVKVSLWMLWVFDWVLPLGAQERGRSPRGAQVVSSRQRNPSVVQPGTAETATTAPAQPTPAGIVAVLLDVGTRLGWEVMNVQVVATAWLSSWGFLLVQASRRTQSRVSQAAMRKPCQRLLPGIMESSARTQG